MDIARGDDTEHGDVARESRAELFIPGVPAAPEQLTAVRSAVSDWIAQVGVAGEQHNDVVLATYEAMANVVAHAYLDRSGVFDVCAYCQGSDLVVTVTDHGKWREAVAPSPARGRGLQLIRALAGKSDISTDGFGTRVCMRWPLAAVNPAAGVAGVRTAGFPGPRSGKSGS